MKDPKINVRLRLSDWSALLNEGDEARLADIYVSIKEQILSKKSAREAIDTAKAATEQAHSVVGAFEDYRGKAQEHSEG